MRPFPNHELEVITGRRVKHRSLEVNKTTQMPLASPMLSPRGILVARFNELQSLIAARSL